MNDFNSFNNIPTINPMTQIVLPIATAIVVSSILEEEPQQEVSYKQGRMELLLLAVVVSLLGIGTIAFGFFAKVKQLFHVYPVKNPWMDIANITIGLGGLFSLCALTLFSVIFLANRASRKAAKSAVEAANSGTTTEVG